MSRNRSGCWVQARQLVHAITELAGTASRNRVRAWIADPLVRYEARRVGGAGELRGPLALGRHRQALGEDGCGPEDASLDELEGLLPSVDVELRRRLRGHEIAARSHDGSGAIRVRIPDHRETMVEQLAAVIDTTLAIKRRLGVIAAGVRRLDFYDGGVRQMGKKWSGLAEPAFGVAWLSPHLAFADAFGESRRYRRSTGGPKRPPAQVLPPYTEIDGVTAHESWHLIDCQVIGSGRSFVEFNRALGEELGVATLEHALRGAEQGAAPEWRDAYERLSSEVSPYATTNPREAAAEMFKLWWCSDGNPRGIVAVFGDLLERSVQGR